jgi:hypothetical protein
MLTIQLSGWTLITILMVVGGYFGWKRGIRAFLTVTVASALAYLIFISGGEQFVGYINNLYSNLPKIFAILTGGNPNTVATWQPLFGTALNLPLAVRVILFIMMVALAFFFNKKAQWYAQKGDPLSKQLGAFSGALTALIWISAITTFWGEAAAVGGAPAGTFGSVVRTFPDVTTITPWLISILFVIIAVGIATNVPKLWKA